MSGSISCSRPLRILVAHNVPNNRRGGMSRLLCFIHDEIAREGHHIAYFCSEEVPTRLNGRWGRFTFPLLLLRHAIAAARSGRPYDIVNVHEPCSAAVTVLRRWAGNPRVVVTSHGVEQRGWELGLEEARLGRVALSLKGRIAYPLTSLWQSRLGLRLADHIFCLSYEDRDYLIQRMGVHPDRITRVYPAADPAYGTIAGERRYHSADRILFFGTWLQRKGIDDLVAAFEVLARRYPSVELLVLGAGWPEDVVRASFPEDLRERVRCARPGTEADLARELLNADVFMLPSLFEGTPQTLIEAMLSGLPIITTATCGMRDVIQDGHNGLLVPIRDAQALVAAFERLRADAALRRRLGQQAHADAKTLYTWPRVAAPVRQVYEQLCRSAPKKGERPFTRCETPEVSRMVSRCP
jgi:glycosyltransferase involved in cell wall biosynthesis